jgi:hypothetical protein
MLTRKHPTVIVLVLVAGLAACGSNGPSGPPPSPCTTAMVPATVHLTVSGFSKCSCFNGSFTLTKETQLGSPNGTEWSSMAIMGCPGQTTPAYLKFSIDPNSFGLGITDQGSDPGSGNSDFSPVTSGTCSPFDMSGGGSRAGNITSFCPSTEDLYMSWSVTK